MILMELTTAQCRAYVLGLIAYMANRRWHAAWHDKR